MEKTKINIITRPFPKLFEILYHINFFKNINSKFKTFHICEAPGMFIITLDYYIKNYINKSIARNANSNIKFEWTAQTLKPNKWNKAFGDDLNLIKNNKNKWMFGDITNIENIKYYKQYCNDTNLITCDGGLPFDFDSFNSNKLLFAVLIFMIINVPIKGNFILKMYLPIYEKWKFELLFIIYECFEWLYFIKPSVNKWWPEFYIIGKNRKHLYDKCDYLFE